MVFAVLAVLKLALSGLESRCVGTLRAQGEEREVFYDARRLPTKKKLPAEYRWPDWSVVSFWWRLPSEHIGFWYAELMWKELIKIRIKEVEEIKYLRSVSVSFFKKQFIIISDRKVV